MIYNILDTLEDLRGETDIMAKMKAAYRNVSEAFIAQVIRFDEQIRQISLNKEVTHVKIAGSIDIYKVFGIDEKAYTIQADIADTGRGIHQRCVDHDCITERLYEEEKTPGDDPRIPKSGELCSCGEPAGTACTIGTCAPRTLWCQACYERKHLDDWIQPEILPKSHEEYKGLQMSSNLEEQASFWLQRQVKIAPKSDYD